MDEARSEAAAAGARVALIIVKHQDDPRADSVRLDEEMADLYAVLQNARADADDDAERAAFDRGSDWAMAMYGSLKWIFQAVWPDYDGLPPETAQVLQDIQKNMDELQAALGQAIASYRRNCWTSLPLSARVDHILQLHDILDSARAECGVEGSLEHFAAECRRATIPRILAARYKLDRKAFLEARIKPEMFRVPMLRPRVPLARRVIRERSAA